MWSATETDADESGYIYLDYSTTDALLLTNGFKRSGMTVRCVRDI